MREACGVREACVLAHSVPRLPSSPREEGEEEGERLSRRGVEGEWRGGAAGGARGCDHTPAWWLAPQDTQANCSSSQPSAGCHSGK